MDKNRIMAEIKSLICEIVRNEIKTQNANCEYVYDGVVEGYIDETEGNEKLCVNVKDTQIPIEDIQNFSNASLQKGSIVRIHAKGGRLNDSYIGQVFNKNNLNK